MLMLRPWCWSPPPDNTANAVADNNTDAANADAAALVLEAPPDNTANAVADNNADAANADAVALVLESPLIILLMQWWMTLMLHWNLTQ